MWQDCVYLYRLVLCVLPDETFGCGVRGVGGVAIGHVGGALQVQAAKGVLSRGQHHTHLSQKPALKLILENTHRHNDTHCIHLIFPQANPNCRVQEVISIDICRMSNWRVLNPKQTVLNLSISMITGQC